MALAPLLRVFKEGQEVASVPIDREISIGRSEGCVIRLQDRAVSRDHARILPTSQGASLEARNEFAPVSLNGADVRVAEVRPGDVISIGPYLLRFEGASASPAQNTSVGEPAFGLQDSTPAVSARAPAPVPLSETTTEPELLSAAPIDLPAGSEFQMDSPSPALVSNGEIETPQSADSDIGGENPLGGEPSPVEAEAGNSFLSAEVPALEVSGAESNEDGKTRVTTAFQVSAKILIAPELANLTELTVGGAEVSIGRGKECDLVLNDRKASRKHAVIRRVGTAFILKDLGSANGTFVNGVKISEQEIAHEDVLKVADTEMRFDVRSAEYAQKESEFLSVDEEHAGGNANSLSELPPMEMPPMEAFSGVVGGAPGQGIAGIDPGVSGGKKTLLEKFRTLPKQKQMIYGGAALLLLMAVLYEDEAPKKDPKAAKKPVSAASAQPSPRGPKTFEQLTPEEQKFVQAHYQLALESFKNRDYDRALFEVNQIFPVLEDHLDARSLQRYSQDEIRKQKVQEAEKKKKEEEEKAKARVQALVEEAREIMAKKDYPKAKEKFGEILAIDPENTMVPIWNKEIDQFDEMRAREVQEKKLDEELNKYAWDSYRRALDMRKEGRCHEAIVEAAQVGDKGGSDKTPAKKAKVLITGCKQDINGKRDPLLQAGRDSERAGEFAKAYKSFMEATKVDPPHPEGYAGMERVKEALHEKSRVLYTEGVMFEYFSEYKKAQDKFAEILNVAPEGDLYYGRAKRKLSRYLSAEANRSPSGSPETGAPSP